MTYHALNNNLTRPITINESETKNIVDFIRKNLGKTLSEFDYIKYPKEKYNHFLISFPSFNIKNQDIEDALKWKWGHYKKTNFPGAHKELIQKIQEAWPRFLTSNEKTNPRETFYWWKNFFSGKAYITSAFITHLIHHQKPIPIIDQHNFRGMNNLISQERHEFTFKKKPSKWEDIEKLTEFMRAISQNMIEISFGDLDKFLMMHGKNHARR